VNIDTGEVERHRDVRGFAQPALRRQSLIYWRVSLPRSSARPRDPAKTGRPQDDGGAPSWTTTRSFLDGGEPNSRSARVADNGNIYNIWTLSLKTGELKQYTDTLTGNVSPIVLRDTKTPRIAFVTYYKGEYGIHTLPREEPLHTVASADFGEPGPVIDFQPPISHTLVKSNIRTKGTFEKLFLEGRPPVNVGVTSGGDLFGGTQVTFTDVLGDKQFNIFAIGLAWTFEPTSACRRLGTPFRCSRPFRANAGVLYDPPTSSIATRRGADQRGPPYDHR
jgi:hypothetical protein